MQEVHVCVSLHAMALGKGMNLSVYSESWIIVEKENSEFKSTLFSLEIDFVSIQLMVECLGKYLYIRVHVCVCVCVCVCMCVCVLFLTMTYK